MHLSSQTSDLFPTARTCGISPTFQIKVDDVRFQALIQRLKCEASLPPWLSRSLSKSFWVSTSSSDHRSLSALASQASLIAERAWDYIKAVSETLMVVIHKTESRRWTIEDFQYRDGEMCTSWNPGPRPMVPLSAGIVDAFQPLTAASNRKESCCC